MVVAICILAAVVILEFCIIVKQALKIEYLRERLFKQIRVNGALKQPIKIVVNKQDIDDVREIVQDKYRSKSDMLVKKAEITMPIEMTEVKP